MLAHGDGAKAIWMTELGWNTQSTRPRSCNTGSWAGQKRARRVEEAPGALAARGLPLPRGGPVRRRSRSGSACRTSAARATRAATACSTSAAAASRRRRRSSGCGAGSGRSAAAATSTARRRRSRCSSRANGRRFAGKLSVRVRAFDNRGGTGLQRIYMSRNGRHVLTWGGNGGSIKPWWGSEDWRLGRPHAHVPRARQRAQRDIGHRDRREAAAVVQKLTPALQDTRGGCR